MDISKLHICKQKVTIQRFCSRSISVANRNTFQPYISYRGTAFLFHQRLKAEDFATV